MDPDNLELWIDEDGREHVIDLDTGEDYRPRCNESDARFVAWNDTPDCDLPEYEYRELSL